MTTKSVSFHKRKPFSAVTVKQVKAKAQRQADRSSSPERFMELYEAALLRLRGGADLADNCFTMQSPLEMAAETEALAAFRMLLSYAHPYTCLCLECRQRRIERAQRSRE